MNGPVSVSNGLPPKVQILKLVVGVRSTERFHLGRVVHVDAAACGLHCSDGVDFADEYRLAHGS
jgi:hypothetical protein